MAVTFHPGCAGGDCEKHADGLQLVALDVFGERVISRTVAALGMPLAGPSPWLEIRVGDEPTCGTSPTVDFEVLAGRSCPAITKAFCLEGDPEWLVEAIGALVQLTTLPGIACIDFADFRTAFFGRGPVHGVSAPGASVQDAGRAAIEQAADLLADAAWILVHINAPAPACLFDVNDVVVDVGNCSADPEVNVLFNFYRGACDPRVTLLIA